VYRIAEPVRGHRDSRKSRRTACIACVLVSASDDGNTSRAAPRTIHQSGVAADSVAETAAAAGSTPAIKSRRQYSHRRSSQATTCSWDKRPHTMRRACDSVHCPGDLPAATTQPPEPAVICTHFAHARCRSGRQGQTDCALTHSRTLAIRSEEQTSPTSGPTDYL